ncbi:MAG: glycosyl hydrolase [[Clostridium] fimetarium]|nr:glycosyl hydrolase [Alistipes timonensis]MCM1405641.1 glycosyl hydrolase [[Clostridium] fimetarium]
MKKYKIVVISALLAAALPAAAKSPKRGLSENEFQFKAQMAALAPGVSWFYNWGPEMGRYLANETAMEYVPMCWNGYYDAEKIRAWAKAHPECGYLLGFNEPNFTNQADMTPQEAAAKWPEVVALAKELGLKLVAPALNTSPNPPYQDPTKWMDEFVALVGEDAFDYTAVHSYGGFDALRNIATTFHDRYGKDVWVTEFCFWPEEGNPNSYVAPDTQIASMMQSVEWLEKTPWIFRYAWFKAVGNSDAPKGPNFGLLISAKAEVERELSEQGKVYVNMGTFDPGEYHGVNTAVAASDYIAQTGCLMGASNDPGCPSPIEITRFNAGATLDYQFDVPSDGEYTLTLSVGGFGEPTRFDPSIGVYSVGPDGADGEELASMKNITLPNSDEVYATITLPLTLTSGKQTIRLKDTAPYSPSGIRIASLTLSDGSASAEAIGVDSADAPVDVYTLQGIRVRESAPRSTATAGLPAGLYLVGSEKRVVN